MQNDPQPTWPHLENLDRVPDLLERSEWVTVTEKIHGFNARFGRTPEGVFWVGSRSNVVHEGDGEIGKDSKLQGFTEWALSRDALVPVGFTFYGEWAGEGIQKGIAYGPKRFYLFGLRKYAPHGETLLPWPDIARWAGTLGCSHVPLIYDGNASSLTVAQLDEWRQRQSAISEDQAEGIVISPWPPIADVYGHTVIGKFKAPQFSERAHARKEHPAPSDLTNVQAFVDDYATDERLGHVLDRLSEDGLDGLDRRNTGPLLKTFYEDVVREGRDDHAKLSENDQKLVGKVLNQSVKVLVDARRTASVAA